jgi:hypothetical protein
MAADRSAAELERSLAERADHLLRTAVLLTGSRDAGDAVAPCRVLSSTPWAHSRCRVSLRVTC